MPIANRIASTDKDLFIRSIEVEKTELLLEYQKARRSLLQPLMTENRENYAFDMADYMACADASVRFASFIAGSTVCPPCRFLLEICTPSSSPDSP